MLNYRTQPDSLGSLTAGQRSMWAVQQLRPEVPYDIAGFLAIDHHVEVERLTVACESAAAHFGTQCARLSLVDGEPVFIVDRQLPQKLQSLRCIDLRAEPDPVEAAHRWMNDNYHRPIDLFGDQLTDLALLRITDNLSYFYLRAHHVLFDGYGAYNFIRHIAAAYSGSVADTSDVDFSEFALIRDADQKYQQSSRSHADAEYWQNILRGTVDVTDLGGTRTSLAPRHPQMRELACRHLSENNQLDVARVIATMAVFIAKTTGRQDVSMSLPVSARTTAALKKAAGMVANMVPLRICVEDGDTIGELTDQVAKALVGALRHQQFRRWPDVIAGATHLDNLDFGPIINILDFATPFEFGPSEPVYNILTNGPIHDVAVNIYPRLGHGAPRIQLAWNPDRYSADDITLHITRLESLFDRLLVADASVVVGEVSLVDGGERELVLSGWSGDAVGAPVGLVGQVLAAAVAADPEAVAVIDGDRQVSYRQLDEWSTRLARVLIEAGVGPQRAVGVALDRCAELVVAWWAVIKAGGIYVPVDSAHPVQRLTTVLDAVEAVCVLTRGADTVPGAGGRPVLSLDTLDLADRRAEAITDAERLAPLRVGDTAYVLFTSGSTGTPKGVAVGHAGLLGVAAAQRELFTAGPRARILMVAAPTFDLSIFEWLWAAGSAATLVVAPPQAYAGHALTHLLHQQRVNAAILTPTVLASLDPTPLTELHTLIAGAEPCPPELVTTWAPGRRMFNAYGPTEATIWATCTTALSPGQPITIGTPIPGVCALVLDTRLHPAPIGVVGELYLAGPALAHGYVRQPELTAERFIANPHGTPGARLYRTGDLARWTPQGSLQCLGRTDTQIKLRGQRIELGEIENALLACPHVTQAAATIHHTPTGTDHLIAYIGPAPLDPTTIRHQLSRRLPAYLTPTHVIVLDEFPHTPSGKLDRNALPPPVFTPTRYRPPHTPTEHIIADTFAEVLGLDRVGLDDNFFTLGGDSLLATRATTRLQLALNTEIPIRTLFDTPTVTDLANHLHHQRAGRTRPPVTPVRRPERIPLSYAQQRLWFLNQFEGGAATYNMPTAFRISGALDVEALDAALDDVIARHESLRTIFADVDGVPYQEVLPARTGMWRRGGAAVVSLPEQEVGAELEALAGYRFDLSAEIPIRAQIYSMGTRQHALGIVVHHIACDGWSLAPMVRDMGQAYRARRLGRAPQWAPLAVQYVDYTLWQREWLGAETDPESVIAGQLRYWREQLADLPEVVSLPADRARPPVPSYRGEGVEFHIDPQVWAGVKTLAAAHNATASMVLQAVLAVVLHRVGAGEDIVVGAPIAGRLDEALDDLVGFFVNTWVLRVGVTSRDRFSDVLHQVRQRALDAYGHQDVPFELLVEQLNPVRSAAHHPLFQVAMAFQNNIRPEAVTIDGVSVEELEVCTRTAKFDLDFELGEVPTEDPAAPMAAGTVSYATDLFDRSSIERLVTRFMRVLEAVVVDASVVVGEVSLLDGGERELVLSGWSGDAVGAPVGLVGQVLAAAVAADPEAVAVIDGDRQVSYRQLDEWSTRLARVLIEAGVGPQRAVGVALDRCAELVVAWWAVIKAGGIYVPVDSAHPVQRLTTVLDAVEAVCVLTRGADTVPGAGGRPVLSLDTLDLADRRAEAITDAERLAPLRVGDTAYVLFTSGSTGTPKGVAVGHAGLLGVAAAQRELFTAGPRARILMVAAPTFDLSIFEWLWAAGSAATLVVAPPQAYAGHALTHLLHQQRVNAAILTPTVLASLDPTPLTELHTLIAGAEPCPPELVTTWAPGRRMFNAYGPTEATIWATCTTALSPGQPITIGTPIPGVCALVLDTRLHPAPIGVVGELYLAGPALAHGYVCQPELTAERFIANPHGTPGARLYRTGDLARWTPQGSLQCLGRTDTQIKLRGQRIELGEIENALLACPHVTQAAATIHHTPTGTDHLIAYIALEDASSGDTAVQDAEIVEQWQCMYDELYGADVGMSELGMDFRGWNSSFTGDPIPLDEMVEWRSAITDRIMALRPRRVLEIGAGSGLVLSQIAPRCEHYVGTDMSAVAIDTLAHRLEQSQVPWRDRVQLLTRPAHVTEGLPRGYFDTIILNSVIQYFPHAGYLADLIDNAVDLLSPGGAVFIGDVRNHKLQGVFHTAVALARAATTGDVAEIRQCVHRAILSETELLVAPEFFTSWVTDHPTVAGLDIQVKRGSGDNELNRYRYDVIIHRAPTPVRSVAAASAWRWADCADLSGLHSRLTSRRPAVVRVTNIPRTGLITDVHLQQGVADGLSLADARAQAAADTAIPEELHRLGEATGYRVAVTWGTRPGTLDAVFITGAGPLTDVYLPPSGSRQYATHTNVPRTNTKINAVRQWLGARLPDYMVPAQVVVLDEFPLTPSGKIDRNALPATVFAATPSRAPRTRAEQAVADVFAEVLGLDRVGLDDDFFAMGGDSMVSIQVVSACRARGVWFSSRDVFERRTAARLAEVAETAPSGQALKELPGAGVGDVPLTPIVRDLVSHGGGFDRFVQSMMVQLPIGVDRARIVETVSAVIARHDMLRARLWRDPSAGWRMQTSGIGSVDVDALVRRVPFAADALDQELASLASDALDAAVDRMDPSAGSVFRLVWLDPVGEQDISGRSGRLIIVAHHLVVDAVSWRIIVFDLMRAWEQVTAGRRAVLPPAGTSMRRWAHGLEEAARRGDFDAELAAWTRIVDGPDPLVGSRPFDSRVDVMSALDRVQLRLPHEVFEPVLATLPALFGSGAQDGLLAALAVAVAVWRSRRGVDEPSVLVHLEGHGREESVVAGADLSQTVGWFTTVFPARLDVSGIDVDDVLQGGAAAGALIKSIKEQLAAIPHHGIGYGVLRHLTPVGASAWQAVGHPQIAFNYLGRIAGTELPAGSDDGAWGVTPEFTALTSTPDADMPALATIHINAMVLDDEFDAQIAYPTTLLAQGDVEELVELWRAVLVGLARHTDMPGAGGHTPSDFPLVSVAQDDLTAWEAGYPGLSDVWPLAPLQAGLFFHALLAESSVDAYTVQTVIDIAGDVDTARLRAAAQGIIDRHDNLRTAFVTTLDGAAAQVVLKDVRVPWLELDLTGSADPDAEFTRFTESDRLQRFDLTTPPLLRFALVTKGRNKSAMVITHHHILLDGWSSPLLLQEFLTLYAADGDHSALSPSRPFRDYLEWVSEADTERSARAWRHALAGLDEPTMLSPADPTRRIASPPGKYILEFDDEHSTCIAAFAARTGVTLNTVVQLAWGIVLSQLTGRDDVVFGATVSGRPAGLPGVDSMIGLLINTVPARLRIRPTETVTAALHRLQSEQAALIEHHHSSLSDIHRLAGPGAVFDTAIAFESYPVDTTALQQLFDSTGGLRVERIRVTDATHYPLSLAVSFDARLRVEFSYLTEVFDTAAVERIAGFYRRVLGAVVVDASVVVGEVSLVDGGERELVLSGWSGDAVGAPVGLVGQVLAAAVAADPEAVAVIDGDRQVSYRQLDEWSTRLARVLIEAGVGPQRAVGVALDRCAELVVAWWAVIKAGGIYVPVDSAHPVQRLTTVLDAVEAVCVLTRGADTVPGAGGRPVLSLDTLDLADRRAEAITDAERLAPLRVGDTAYVLFTSGSTGTPKGVAVGHAGLLGVAAAQRELFTAGPRARILMVAAPTFDLSIFEWLWAAGSAATLVVAPPQAYAGHALTHLLHQQRVNAAILTPTVLASLDPTPLTELHTLIAGAEPCPPELVTTWAPGRRMFNAYGPTEATIWATCTTALSPGQPITIGTPIPGVCALVLDTRLHPAPIGVVGELYLAGPALAHGYVCQPELTAERFIANPHGTPGARLYRTGDLARWTPQGSLQCLGRTDTQIKLRGQRIELGEIENALLACPHVTQAAATIHHTPTGTDHLIAYIGPAPLDPTTIRHQLSRRLPAYLTPTHVIVLDEFPHTPSGKLDRNALPPPVFTPTRYRPPHTPTEHIIADTFAEVLGLDRVGLDDNFFTLGGDSLLATRATTRLQLALNTEIPIRTLFDTPTVTDLANHLHRRTDFTSVQEVVPVQTLKKGSGVPLFCIHPGGGISWPYHALGSYLDCPIIGIQQILQPEEAAPRSLRDMARNYANRLQAVYPTGPYNLLGWSFGGVIAHEVAIELRRRGYVVAYLILLDADPTIDSLQNHSLDDWRKQLEALRLYDIGLPEVNEPLTYEQIDEFAREQGPAEYPRYRQLLDMFVQNVTSGMSLYRTHEPAVFDGDVLIISAAREASDRGASLQRRWRPYVAGNITVYSVDATHQEMLTHGSLDMYGEKLKDSLTRGGASDVSDPVCVSDQFVACTTPDVRWSRAGLWTAGRHVHEGQRQGATHSSSECSGHAL